MAFLWSGGELNHKCAKVKWANVCAPKDEGGLGFRRVKDCNAVAMCKLLWDLSKKADSLWIKWVHTYIIKGQNMWHMVIPADCSWTIKKIFRLRELCQPLILYKVGNGTSTFAWLDNWHPLGPLYKKYGTRVCADIDQSLSAKVSSLIHNGGWKWPRGRNRIMREVKDFTPEGFLPDVFVEDSVIWIPSKNGIFSMKSAWNTIRRVLPAQEWCKVAQEWCKVVWFKGHVPRWAFILWMAMQIRLNTKDRLSLWGIV
ncbi:hypothetical protein RHMOL_Rhmol12G0096800 [Rhododendron molle]|uniref:Uncharacterized protein n=3 Tax=Rhododendron molle TaxID=49168 RepID=A0ACC0LG64_RHOML|nr:hypothetical protein RHMOL_Rhmol12G0096800 [Rhododendron molle]